MRDDTLNATGAGVHAPVGDIGQHTARPGSGQAPLSLEFRIGELYAITGA
jgi:hypothetical protein